MNKIILITLLSTLFSCSSYKIVSVATQGTLAQKEFTKEIKFDYEGKHIFIDVEINGKTYPFLFDTGWEISSIDESLADILDFQPIKKHKINGSSLKKQRIEFGFLSSLSISGIEFNKTGIGIIDLSFIKSPFPNKKIAGVIGANVLRKVFWQIDYKKNTILFSDKLENIFTDSKAVVINMSPRNSTGWGYGKIEVVIDGTPEKFIFDTGSSGRFTGNFKLLDKLNSNNTFPESEENLINIKNLKIGDLSLDNVPLNIESEVGLLIGNGFWENYIVTIDWTNNKLFLSTPKGS